jgi:hypothetical protein
MDLAQSRIHKHQNAKPVEPSAPAAPAPSSPIQAPPADVAATTSKIPPVSAPASPMNVQNDTVSVTTALQALCGIPHAAAPDTGSCPRK